LEWRPLEPIAYSQDQLDFPTAIDDWGLWSEITPLVASQNSSNTKGSPERLDPSFLRTLEPLIAELWHRIEELPPSLNEAADALHEGLVEVSTATREADPGRVHRALVLLLKAVGAIALNMTAALLWDEYGQKIKALIDLLH
jgi:hypothetical protein